MCVRGRCAAEYAEQSGPFRGRDAVLFENGWRRWALVTTLPGRLGLAELQSLLGMLRNENWSVYN